MSTQPLPTAAPQRRRWWLRPAGWAVALLAVLFGWGGWRVYDDHAAVREVQALGFRLEESASPFAVIRADWHAAFRLATWTEHRRALTLPDGSDLAALRPLLLRLHPTVLTAYGCRNVDALRGLTGLRVLGLYGSDVQDLAPLAGLAQLQSLSLTGCTGVTDLAPLAGLAQLRWLDLVGCTGVADLAPLAGLTQLPWLGLVGCTGVADLAPLAGLAQLQWLYLIGCTGLSAETVAAFRQSHPKTHIFGL